MLLHTNNAMEFNVSDLKDGECFNYNGFTFVRLGEEQGGILCITKDFRRSVFDTSTQPSWENSKIRKMLYEDFIPMMNKEDLLPMELDLTPVSLDLEQKGTEKRAKDIVGLLSLEQCRKYKKVVPRYDTYIWLCSPHYYYSNYFCCVDSDGDAYYGSANISCGCAPVLLFKKEEKVIFDTNILFDA